MDRVLQRRDTAANWSSANPVLAEGELGIITDTKGYKIGDGSTAWNDLEYPANPTQVVNELGDSETAAISQEIVSNELEKIKNEIFVNIHDGNIGVNEQWSNINVENTYKYIIIPISYYSGMTITVRGSSAYKWYAWLTSYEVNPSGTPNYVSGTSRLQGYPTNVEIPSTANYLYISVANDDGIAYVPSVITVDTFTIFLNIRDEILNIKKDIKREADNINSLENTVDEINNNLTPIIRNGNISSSAGLWKNTNSGTYKNMFIPVSLYVGKNITVENNSSLTYIYHAFLTSFDITEDTTPNYVTGTSLNINYPSNKMIPETAEYLYLTVAGEDGIVYEPLKVSIGEEVIETNLYKKLYYLGEEQSNIADQTNSLKAIVNGSDEVTISVAESDVKNGNISGNLVWNNITGGDPYKHIIIPIAEYIGRSVTATGSSPYKYYAWLTNYDNVANYSEVAFLEGTTRYSGYPTSIKIPDGAKYLYLSVSGQTGEVFLPTVKILSQNSLISQVSSGKKGSPGEKVVFSVSVNCHIDLADDSTSDTEEDMQNDWATLTLPESYSLTNLCPLIVYCHGAGGSVTSTGSGESDGRVPFWNHYGYAVLQVNGLPQPFQTTVIKGGGFGTPIAINCYYKAYLYAIENYNLNPNCYLIGESMGGLTSLNLLQNTPMQIRAIALDAPLVSIENLWKSPTWTQEGDYKNTIWYLLAKMYNFSFAELNEAHSTNYTLDTFPFNTDDNDYNSTYVQELYTYNKDKIVGFDPFIATSISEDIEYKYIKCPIKIWRGAQDSATGRLPYCKNFVAKVRNAYCKAEEKYPPYSKHVLSSGTESDGITQVTIDSLQYSIYLEEIRIWLEKF